MKQLGDAPGAVSILNIGTGDIHLSFDKNNPAERIRAARIVRDMLRRGYALLVEVVVDGEKKFMRAKDFDDEHCQYVIADLDPVTAAAADAQEEQEVGDGQQTEQASSSSTSEKARDPNPRRGRTRKVDATSTRAVAVGRTAGG